MKKFLHVGFNTTKPRVQEWKTLFNQATDWLRYAPNCWILYTGRSPQSWYELIKPQLQEGEDVFICELVITNRQGWLPKNAWDWVKKSR